MSILFDPSAFLRRAAPTSVVEQLVTQRLTVNRFAVSALTRSGVLPRRRLEDIALRVIRGYREKYREERAAGATVAEARLGATNGNRLLIHRVQNAMVHEVNQEIKDFYRGEFYEWLPSDAEEPDPLHQLNYGKRFQVGKGEEPGDRWGCKCGRRILVAGEKLFEEDFRVAA